MDVAGVQRWYQEYLDDFIELGRGRRDDLGALLAHYGVPLLLVTDDGPTVLGEAQLQAYLRQQLDALRADGYDRSDLLESETAVLNRSGGTHRARVVRLRADGTEIARLQATYLVSHGPDGHRILAIVAHSTP